MKTETLGIIAGTVVLVSIIFATCYYNISVTKYRMENGYRPTTLPGMGGVYWTKDAPSH